MDQTAKINDLLGLRRSPVAVRVQSSAPDSLERIDEPAYSGCTYWRLASEGKTFTQLDVIVDKLVTIVDANRELEKFHYERVSKRVGLSGGRASVNTTLNPGL